MTANEARALTTDGGGGGEGDASAVFALLSNETRLGIVRELARAEAEQLSFSDLRCRVGVDDSGRFNYHLRRLRGRLVEKTDAGYVLTPTGRWAATAVGTAG